jgi:hypothetical protein
MFCQQQIEIMLIEFHHVHQAWVVHLREVYMFCIHSRKFYAQYGTRPYSHLCSRGRSGRVEVSSIVIESFLLARALSGVTKSCILKRREVA